MTKISELESDYKKSLDLHLATLESFKKVAFKAGESITTLKTELERKAVHILYDRFNDYSYFVEKLIVNWSGFIKIPKRVKLLYGIQQDRRFAEGYITQHFSKLTHEQQELMREACARVCEADTNHPKM